MVRTRHQRRSGIPGRLWIWCVLLALPIYGLSGSLVQLLGPAHFHRGGSVPTVAAVAPGTVALVDFRRENVGETRLTPAELHELSHRQSAFMRHYHAAEDDTVVIVESTREDGSTDEPGSAGAGSACLSLAPPHSLDLHAPASALHAWRRASAAAVPTVDLMPPDHPPKT